MLENDILEESVVAPTRYANFGPRLLASILDFLCLIPLIGVSMYFSIAAPDFTIYLIVILLSMVYKPGMEKIFGATLGKMITKLRVVDEAGGNISWGQALMRYLPWAFGALAGIYLMYTMFQIPGYSDIDGFADYGAFMMKNQDNIDTTLNTIVQSVSFFVPLISALIMLGNKKRQAAHDTLAETYVIHKQPAV